MSVEQKTQLQARTWLAECGSFGCESRPTYAPNWTDEALRSRIDSVVPNVTYVDAPPFGPDGLIANGGVWIRVKKVRTTDRSDVVMVDAESVFGNLGGHVMSYLYKWESDGWQPTTSDETGVTVTYTTY